MAKPEWGAKHGCPKCGIRFYDLGKDDPEGFCLPPGFPRVNGVPFPTKIIQTPALVVMLYETRTTFRQIFLDAHTLAADPQPTWMGYSTGKWDGDTLVVQTVGFNDKTWLDDAGHPHSDAMRVTERIRRDVENGRINAILITSGSVAEQVREQFPEIPDETLLAAIGPRTARDAEKAGLPVSVVADRQTVDALIDAVSHFTLPHAADEFAP